MNWFKGSDLSQSILGGGADSTLSEFQLLYQEDGTNNVYFIELLG